MNRIRKIITEAEVEAAHDSAKKLAAQLMNVLGMIEEGGSYTGNVSLAIAGGALGIAAGKLMAAASDECFRSWLNSVENERRLTRVERFGTQ